MTIKSNNSIFLILFNIIENAMKIHISKGSKVSLCHTKGAIERGLKILKHEIYRQTYIIIMNINQKILNLLVRINLKVSVEVLICYHFLVVLNPVLGTQCFRIGGHEDIFVLTSKTLHIIHFWNP